MRTSRPLGALIGTLLAAIALTGCQPVVSLDPAADAADPGCADVVVRLPDALDGLPRRDTDAQATAAWGSPPAVLVLCGVEVPSASSYTCIDVDGVWWLRNAEQEPTVTFRLYGREPAIDVVVDTDEASAASVLTALADAVATTQPNGHRCVDAEDSLSVGS
ncbi:DUF3515 domain-containing protein [Homoserinibacter sp. GY 40078]|uniref:DUF3515 domain-containing protein n=1 Tax=Homoserinibacter sp. GY 40078 TaxID=2603275 RepID=UPI0011C9882F|nr:DUF3515 domain-containing protein [Homoserinibacter sp. GY 40078]TXK16410.1 DUF3515 domain-containing protein [Homoserinibacter sp. GY 40078]